MGASGTPRADDSLLNRAGQAVGTMLTSVAGRVTFAAGGGATLLTAGTASEVSIPAAAVGVEMVVGSVINGVRIATTPMQRGTKAGGSITEPNAAKTGEITENGVTIRRNPGDHPPPHLHVNGRGPNTRIGQNGNPLRGDPALSRAQRQAVQQQKKEIRKWIKQIMKEHRFNIF